jgi:hypothetical protein
MPLTKPTAGTAPNGPLASHFDHWWGILNNSGVTSPDEIGSNNLTLSNTSGVLTSGLAWASDAEGPYLALTAAIPTPVALAATVGLTNAGPWTVVFRMAATGTGYNGAALGDTTNTSDFVILDRQDGILWYRSSSSVDVQPTCADMGTEHTYVLVSDGTKIYIYQEGTLLNPGGTTVGGIAGPSLSINALGDGYTSSAFALIGKLRCAGVCSGYAFTSSDVTTFTNDPYAALYAGASFAVTPGAIPASHTGAITLALAGTGTTWTSGSSVAVNNSVTGTTTVTAGTWTRTSNTSATLTVTTGAGNGTCTLIIDGVTSPALAVGAVSIVLSPSSGSTGASQTVDVTGTDTAWLSETASGLFTVSGGTGASITGGSIVVADDTHAHFTLVNGSAAATLTVTETVSGATATFTVNSITGTITVTAPVPYQTFQRDTITDVGPIAIAGTYTGAAGLSDLSVEAGFAGGAFATIGTAAGGAFAGTLTGQAPGQGTLIVRFKYAATITTSVSNIKIGDVLIAAGQSNAAGQLPVPQTYTPSGGLGGSLYRPGTGGWTDGTDAAQGMSTGSFWPLLATQWMADQGVPLAVINVGVGGSGLILPTPSWTKGGSNYAGMVSAVTAARVNGVRGILWYQGETDSLNGVTRPQYLTAFLDFARDAAADIAGAPASGVASPPRVIPFQPTNSGGGETDAWRLAIADAWDVGGHVLGCSGIYDKSNSLHPSSGGSPDALGVVQADRFWAACAAGLLNGTGPARGPKLVAIQHDAARTQLTVTFNQALKTGLTFTAAAWTVVGVMTPATVASVAYATDPSSVVLTLAAPAALPIVVSLGLGSATAGQVVPLGPDLPLPAGGTQNLPAEPFSAVAAVPASGSGGGGSTQVFAPIGCGFIRGI